jgi:hypothetical protein
MWHRAAMSLAAAAMVVGVAKTNSVREGELVVPRALRGPDVDGELDDGAWTSALRSGAFTREDGEPARPHSEARLVWGDGQLFFGLYAADDDVEARIAEKDGPLWLSDAFQIVVRTGGQTFHLDVSPRGTLTDARVPGGGALDFGWSSEARVASDVDGTIGNAKDRDEEWVIEMAIPLASLGIAGRSGEHLELSVRRCDELREGGRACGAWGTEAAPIALVLGK